MVNVSVQKIATVRGPRELAKHTCAWLSLYDIFRKHICEFHVGKLCQGELVKLDATCGALGYTQPICDKLQHLRSKNYNYDILSLCIGQVLFEPATKSQTKNTFLQPVIRLQLFGTLLRHFLWRSKVDMKSCKITTFCTVCVLGISRQINAERKNDNAKIKSFHAHHITQRCNFNTR